MKNLFALSAAFVCLMFIAACDGHKARQVSYEKIDFRTTDDSEMFFKNLRQYYYENEIMDSAGLVQLRLKERVTDGDRPLINLMIVNNWRLDRAYLFVEPEGRLSGLDTLKVQWKNPETGETGLYTHAKSNVREQLAFATALYSSVQQGYALQAITPADTLPVLDTEAEREAFRVTMVDFFRLVNAL